MSAVEIVNPVEPEALAAWSAAMQTTFLAPPNADRVAQAAQFWSERLQPSRTWGAREDGRWVATLGTEVRTLTVPGPGATTSDLAVDAVTAVTVNATHRRRGLLSSMISDSLRAAKDRGDALSYLIAAEWPIYGRFGYGPATRSAAHIVHGRSPGATIAGAPGSMRQVDPQEFAQLGPVVFERSRRRRAGEVSRIGLNWRSQQQAEPREGRQNLFVHLDEQGQPDGLVMWKPGRDFELGRAQGTIDVGDLQAATPQAYAGLWQYLLGIDLVDEIHLHDTAVDEPLRFLLRDGRALQTTYVGDLTWLAILDVPAALTARSYRVSGELVLQVHDTTPHGFAAGRWLLHADGDDVTCTPTDRSADLTLPVQALGSAYLGGYGLAVTGAYEEHSAGAAARFDLMFGTAVEPMCSSGF